MPRPPRAVAHPPQHSAKKNKEQSARNARSHRYHGAAQHPRGSPARAPVPAQHPRSGATTAQLSLPTARPRTTAGSPLLRYGKHTLVGATKVLSPRLNRPHGHFWGRSDGWDRWDSQDSTNPRPAPGRSTRGSTRVQHPRAAPALNTRALRSRAAPLLSTRAQSTLQSQVALRHLPAEIRKTHPRGRQEGALSATERPPRALRRVAWGLPVRRAVLAQLCVVGAAAAG